MCIWYRGWYFEECTCIIWDKSWSCGFRCRRPRRKLLRQFLGICPNCSIMNSIPNSNPSNRGTEDIHEPNHNNVPCDAQYDPSDVFDRALDEHMRHHPWNIMMTNSWAAAGERAAMVQSSVWGPSLNYNTPLSRYMESSQHKSEQQQHNRPAGTHKAPQCESTMETKWNPPSDSNTNPAAYREGDGGYESDEDPVPPEYRYKS